MSIDPVSYTHLDVYKRQGVGHIRKLMRRNIELLCENLSVASGLIEHIDEIAVLKNVLNLAAGQQVFDVLRDPGGDAAPFTEPLPNLDTVCRCLLFLEQKVELVHVIARRLVLGAVDGHAVPDLILHNEHRCV